MASANKAIVIGNLVRDPQIKLIANNQKVASFTLAIEDVFADASNQAVKRVNYPTVKAWGKQVEKLERLHKGDCVGVVGKIVTGSYEGKDGVKRYTTDIQAEKLVVFCLPEESFGRAESPGMDMSAPADMEAAEAEIPF